MEYHVIVEHDPDTGAFTGTVVGLPIVVDADSEEEAIKMAEEGIQMLLEEPEFSHLTLPKVVPISIGA